jgi:hypothetical protein
MVEISTLLELERMERLVGFNLWRRWDVIEDPIY